MNASGHAALPVRQHYMHDFSKARTKRSCARLSTLLALKQDRGVTGGVEGTALIRSKCLWSHGAATKRNHLIVAMAF